MNYILFTNPQTGSPILTALMKAAPPKVVITQFKQIDSWKLIMSRFLKGRLSVEDKMRFYYKLEFHDYNSLKVQKLINIIKKNNIEIGFITSFSYKIPKEFIELFPKGLYNFHPSLLPRHGGANPFFWVVFSGDRYTGTTCHYVTDVLDHGNVLLQYKYPVNEMDAKELFNCYVNDIVAMIRKVSRDFVFLSTNSKAMGVTEYDPNKIPIIDINYKNLNQEGFSRYKRAIKSFN